MEKREKQVTMFEDSQVKHKPTEGKVAQTAGVLKVEGPAISAEEEREMAEIAIAEEVIARG